MIIEEVSKILPALLTPSGWAIIAGIVVGKLVERRYVGRMSAFSNGMAIDIALISITSKHWLLIWYGNFCLLMAGIGALSYWCERTATIRHDRRWRMTNLPQEHYGLSRFCGAWASVIMMMALPSWSLAGLTWPGLNSFLSTVLT